MCDLVQLSMQKFRTDSKQHTTSKQQKQQTKKAFISIIHFLPVNFRPQIDTSKFVTSKFQRKVL